MMTDDGKVKEQIGQLVDEAREEGKDITQKIEGVSITATPASHASNLYSLWQLLRARRK